MRQNKAYKGRSKNKNLKTNYNDLIPETTFCYHVLYSRPLEY